MGLVPISPESDNLDNKFFRPRRRPGDRPGGATIGNQASCVARLTAVGVSAQNISKRCNRRNGFGSANMRLRVTIFHITDTVKIHATIDALDNLVLAAPRQLRLVQPRAPIDLYTRSQTLLGINSFDSLSVKEAYGHIRSGGAWT